MLTLHEILGVQPDTKFMYDRFVMEVHDDKLFWLYKDAWVTCTHTEVACVVLHKDRIGPYHNEKCQHEWAPVPNSSVQYVCTKCGAVV